MSSAWLPYHAFADRVCVWPGVRRAVRGMAQRRALTDGQASEWKRALPRREPPGSASVLVGAGTGRMPVRGLASASSKCSLNDMRRSIMTDETPAPPTPEKQSSPEPSQRSDAEVPVGDMTEEGETDIGPHPSLTHLENLEQADLEEFAKSKEEGES